MQSCCCNLCILKCLIWQTELQRCLPCACGKAILAQVARVAHHVVLRRAQVALMVMLGPAADALVMQLWLALVRFAGQELLDPVRCQCQCQCRRASAVLERLLLVKAAVVPEHSLLVNAAVTAPVRYQLCQYRRASAVTDPV